MDELIKARHELDSVVGLVTRRLQDIDGLLHVANSALRKGRTDVVSERISAAQDDLRALLKEVLTK